MRVHIIQNDPVVVPGTIEEWLMENELPFSITKVFLEEPFPNIDSVDFIILLGGRMGAYEEDKYPWLRKEKQFIRHVLKQNKMMLGICLGCQLIASALGANVFPHNEPEIGWHSINFTKEGKSHPLLKHLNTNIPFFQFHFDSFLLPNGATSIGHTECANQGFTIGKNVLAVQFHPEVNDATVRYFQENQYPNAEGPYINAQEDIYNRRHIKESRNFMIQLLQNFHNQMKLQQHITIE